MELGGVTRFVSRPSIVYAEAQGDYVRLHTADGASHLIRTTLGTLADEWADAGFIRIHRSMLVRRDRIARIRPEDVVLADGTRLPIETETILREGDPTDPFGIVATGLVPYAQLKGADPLARALEIAGLPIAAPSRIARGRPSR